MVNYSNKKHTGAYTVSNEAIQKIKSTESEADAFIEKCAAYNRDRISQAKADAQMRYQAAETKCRSKQKEASEEAAAKALGTAKSKSDAARAEADEMCAAAVKKLPDAVKLIIREIIRKWQ